MPSLGPAEILVVLVIALLVFGPDKMPDMARQAGRAFREFRRVQQHVRSEFHGAIGDLDGTTSAAPTMSNGAIPTAPQGDPVPTLPPLDASASATPSTGDSSPGASHGPAAEGSAANPPPSSPPADPA